MTSRRPLSFWIKWLLLVALVLGIALGVTRALGKRKATSEAARADQPRFVVCAVRLERWLDVARCLDRRTSFARCNPLPALKRHPLPHAGEGNLLEPDLLCSPLPPFGRGVGGEGCATLELQPAFSDLLYGTGI